MIKTINKFFNFCGKENKRKFRIAMLLGVLQAFIQAIRIPAAYLVLRALIDKSLTMHVAWTASALILGSILLSSWLDMKSTMLQTEAGYNAAAQKRIEIAEHLRYVPMGYFNQQRLGAITSVATNTMENLSNLGTRVAIVVSKGYLTTLAIIVMLFFFDPRIGAIAIVGFVVFFGLTTIMRTATQGKSVKKLQAEDALVANVLEYVQGIAEVKTFNLVSSQMTKVDEAVDTDAEANLAIEKTVTGFFFLQNMVNKLTGVLIVLASIFFYLNGSMTLIDTIMMIICSFMIFAALDLAGSFSALLKAMDLCVDKGNAALSAPTMDIEGANLTPEHTTLSMHHVDFSYDTKKIIDDVTLFIPEKQATALIGPSGGGKTTLTQLLARFWDVDKGTVCLGDIDVRDFSYDSLMDHFAFVFQNVYLFNDTIANNIRFGVPDAPMEKVEEAAKKACCHDFIVALPEGYETMIGEGGASLSGGEKQRISIARAILKDAPIIILDEATANVDPENEEKLVKAIDALTKDKTIIMIAHRLKTVRHADQILAVDQGKIVQKGTHDELMRQDGIYKRFIAERDRALGWKIRKEPTDLAGEPPRPTHGKE